MVVVSISADNPVDSPVAFAFAVVYVGRWWGWWWGFCPPLNVEAFSNMLYLVCLVSFFAPLPLVDSLWLVSRNFFAVLYNRRACRHTYPFSTGVCSSDPEAGNKITMREPFAVWTRLACGTHDLGVA